MARVIAVYIALSDCGLLPPHLAAAASPPTSHLTTQMYRKWTRFRYFGCEITDSMAGRDAGGEALSRGGLRWATLEALRMYKQFDPARNSGITTSHAHGNLEAARGAAAGHTTAADTTSPMLRCLDIVVSLMAIIWLAPLLVVVATIVKSSGGGKVLFSQQRVGRGGRTFKCLKFRTMVVDAELRLASLLEADPSAREEWAKDHKLRDDPRIIPLGSFLRKWSLDELPQFLNVLRGDMSIVGPRPIVPSEANRYGRYILSYQACRPGITGLWQVSGRNDVSYRRRVACDVLYSRSKSLRNNILIMLKTLIVVATARGSY